MNAVETNVNLSEWKRVFVQGPVPGRREGSSLAVDVDEGVVYLIGGRLVEEYVEITVIIKGSYGILIRVLSADNNNVCSDCYDGTTPLKFSLMRVSKTMTFACACMNVLKWECMP